MRSLSSAAAALGALGVLAGCSHDWESFDPRLGDEASATSASAAGSGGAGAEGGSASAAGAAGPGGGGATGPGGGGGGPPAGCNKASLVADDFDDGTIDPRWWPNAGPGSISESGGHISIVSGVAPVEDTWQALRSAQRYDLRESAVTVRVEQVPMDGTGAWISVDHDDGYWVEIYSSGGALHFDAMVGEDAYKLIAEAQYDATEHVFWRIRESAGMVHWETSSDGVAFTTHGTLPSAELFPLDLLTTEVGLYKPEGHAGLSTAVFDDFNGGTPSGTYCPVSDLVDDFADGDWGLVWSNGWVDQGVMLSETAGALTIVPPNLPAEGFAGYRAAKSFDMMGGQILVHLVTPANAATSAQAILGMTDRRETGADFMVGGGVVEARAWLEGELQSPLESVPFDADTHRWLRLRDSGTDIVWETSPDGVAWTAIFQTPAFMDLETVHPHLYGGTWEPVAMPGTVRFDDFNLPP